MPPIMANSTDGQYQTDKYLAKISTYTVLMIEKLWLISFFWKKIPQILRSKDLVPTERSYHKEYWCKIWNSRIHCQKVIGKINGLKKNVKVQGLSHSVKIVDIQGKVLSLQILMWNICIKALALTTEKLITGLKFSKNRPNSKDKVTVLEMLVLVILK